MSNSSALSSSCCALILAAGKGTRMHSKKPKVLHTILGEPLLGHVAGALRPLFGEAVWAVIGHEADMVRAAFAGRDLRFVEQKEQLGTCLLYTSRVLFQRTFLQRFLFDAP